MRKYVKALPHRCYGRGHGTEGTTSMREQPIPYGYCQCGCGRMAPLAQCTNNALGYVKGKPVRFVNGHWAKLHGHGQRDTPTYATWSSMMGRCYRPGVNGYRRYGGRGIGVCERWRGPGGFVNFLADMGERPEGMTLDRIDPDGHYEPGNCRWATRSEQEANKRPGMRRHRRDARRRIIATMWHAGESTDVIAEALGSTRFGVHQEITRMRRAGIDMPYRHPSSRSVVQRRLLSDQLRGGRA